MTEVVKRLAALRFCRGSAESNRQSCAREARVIDHMEALGSKAHVLYFGQSGVRLLPSTEKILEEM